MTCKDCIHYDMCSGFTPTDLDFDVFDYCRKGITDEIPDIEERCNSFKDKTRFVELPCKVGDKLYKLFTMEGTAMDPFVSDFTETVERVGFATRNVMGGWNVYTPEDFGKTVFLDKEKALEVKENYVKEKKK